MISSLYIHIPFCAAKCNYCSFNSYTGLEGLQESYVEALCGEIENFALEGHVGPLETVFIGGGTPSHLPPALLQRILDSCWKGFSVSLDAEISIEVNPGTVDLKTFEFFRKAGLNRISFGVQSFDNGELRKIARIHTAAEAVVAVNMARDAGLSNLSLDLMYGLPGQDERSWQHSLKTAISLGVQHLSLYQLTIEEATPLEKMIRSGNILLPNGETLEGMDEITARLTAAAGFTQYEISNYAQPLHQCRHNINYWNNGEYLAAGAGAVSCIQGTRRRNISNPEEYCRSMAEGRSVLLEEETLEAEASFRETVIMGLRMNRGVSVAGLKQRYGIDLEQYYGENLQQLLRGKFLEQTADHLRLTGRGRTFANRVMADLV